MQKKSTKIIKLIAGIIPVFYALSMVILPLLTAKIESIGVFDQPVIERQHFLLFQVVDVTSNLKWALAAFVIPIVMMAVATLLTLIINKKGAFIYQAVAAAIAVAHALYVLLTLQEFIPVVIENNVELSWWRDTPVYLGFGYWFGLVFAIASLILSLVSLKMMNDEDAAPTARQSAPAASAANAGRPAGPSATGAHQIVCISGEFANASFPLNPNETVVIGRDSAVSNIVIVAPKVSRKHCTISFDTTKNMFIVCDCSTNGTYTENGTRLMANMNNPLPSGSVISLGSNENRFRLV